MQQARVNNCFIKNAHKISMNLPDFFCYNKPEKTRNVRFSHVTRLSKLSTLERTGWIKKSKHYIATTLFKKTHRDSGILQSRTAKKLADNENKKNFEMQPSKLLWICIFGAVTKVRTIGGRLFPRSSLRTSHGKLVMKLFEAARWFCWTREKAILTSDASLLL